jgi:hypothetical protein
MKNQQWNRLFGIPNSNVVWRSKFQCFISCLIIYLLIMIIYSSQNMLHACLLIKCLFRLKISIIKWNSYYWLEQGTLSHSSFPTSIIILNRSIKNPMIFFLFLKSNQIRKSLEKAFLNWLFNWIKLEGCFTLLSLTFWLDV